MDRRTENGTGDGPAGQAVTRPLVWHVSSVAEVVSALDTDAEEGLTSSAAVSRLQTYGPNELTPVETTPPWRIFLRQFNDFMIWVLMAAVAVSALEGETIDAVAILAILLLNGVLGFVQEYRAEQAMAALERMAAPLATVVRDGIEREIRAAELVPGDIVLLESGDRIPADGRLVEAAALRVEEASLTGESRATSKVVEEIADPEAVLGDRENLVFAGTSVAVGRGRYAVTATGQSTEMGRIADLLAEQPEEKTPLQMELKGVGKRIALFVLAVAAIVFTIGAWQAWAASGGTWAAALAEPAFRSRVTTALLVAISLAVAAIPEGLPAIVTVALSLGVRRMAERNAIVRKLHAVETLGSTSFICTDKTGTLTLNEMTVRRLVVGLDDIDVLADWALQPRAEEPDAADLQLLLRIAASCNDAHVTADGQLVGDPTETALITAAERLADNHMRPRRIGEAPFDSARKRMTTVHALGEERRIAYMKGGPDVVLGLCTAARVSGETVALTEELRESISTENERLARDGFRTLALAFRDLDASEPAEGEAIEHDMVYVGITGLVDPPRAEVPDAIRECHHAGIQVAMVTGDHALTAEAVAGQIGLLQGGAIITGSELGRMSDEELASRVDDVRIYARVDPEHKLRIVSALRSRGHVVAMTGDGVNDAPALKRADIGIAMGKVGTDVAREAADMVLADDDFATIVVAVREGRVVFENLRKFILFLLSCNVSEVLIVFTTSLLSPGLPALLPLQLLWINLVTDGLPALALGVDPPSSDVMGRGPRRADEGILVRRRQLQVLWQGAAITLAGLAIFAWAEWFMPGHSPARAQTMLFTAIVLTQLLHSFNFRSESASVFSANSFKNRWLVLAFVGSLTLHLCALYVPALRAVFSTVPLSASEWVAVLIASLVPIVLIDAIKVAGARRRIGSA